MKTNEEILKEHGVTFGSEVVEWVAGQYIKMRCAICKSLWRVNIGESKECPKKCLPGDVVKFETP